MHDRSCCLNNQLFALRVNCSSTFGRGNLYEIASRYRYGSK